MSSQLIVALDFDNQNNALQLVDKLDPQLCALKVGSELFTLAGSIFVKQLIAQQFRVFLDLKFHDIPNTVAKACAVAADMGVWMLNVHALGGLDMMRAAKKSLVPFAQDAPLLIAVTILTSFKEGDLKPLGIHQPLQDEVTTLAHLAKSAELDGVVCSAHEAKLIKEYCGSEFITVTPGIRLVNNSLDDQSRVMTPVQALKGGSDYLVIGRPITQASNPSAVLSEIFDDITAKTFK